MFNQNGRFLQNRDAIRQNGAADYSTGMENKS